MRKPQSKTAKTKIKRPIKQKKPQPAQNVKSIIAKALDDERNTVDFGLPGAQLLECVYNPFGNGTRYGPKSVGCIIPDGSGISMPVTLTVECSYTVAHTSGMIELCPPNTTDDMLLVTHTGNNAEVDSATPTASTYFSCAETNFNDMLVDANGPNMAVRLVSAGLKVQYIGDDTHSSGYLRAFSTNGGVRPCTAAATWTTYGNATEFDLGSPQELKRGLTCRTFYTPDVSWAFAAATRYSTSAIGRRPIVVWSGATAGAVLRLRGVMHLMVRVKPEVIPYPILDVPIEPELQQIMAMFDDMPVVTEGNSFKSFIRGISKAGRKAFRYIASHPELALEVGKVLLS
jgi:hypothetical protein